MPNPALKVRDIVTLKSIDLTVKKGEFVCIIGEVGSGKSSLINALLGDMIHVSPETLDNMGHSELNEETLHDIRLG